MTLLKKLPHIKGQFKTMVGLESPVGS